MTIDLSALLEQADQLDAQINFCEVMAAKTASHDRDISQMYQSIAGTLRKLNAPATLTTITHDRSGSHTKEENDMDPAPRQNPQSGTRA
jgi:hypothetical protein